MCQKSVINDPDTVVKEMFEGLSFAYPGLDIDPDKGIVLLKKDRRNRVALLCGSAAGYEPFATGFVGEGMLTAYISGQLKSPPRADVILSVIMTLADLNRGGVLVLLLNYRLEVLNFGIAIERARLLGLKVESIVLVDDCSRWKAMRKENYTNLAYKKGLCGSIFSFKILGALSKAGATMPFLISEARALNFRTTTLGFYMEPFCYPGSGKPLFKIPGQDVVIGLGLNGENGIKVVKQTSAEDVVRQVMPLIFDEANLSEKSAVLLLVNKLSSLTTVESYIITKEVNKYLAKKKVVVLRQVVSRFFTSLDAKGAHISLLNVTGREFDWLHLFDLGTDAYAWPNTKLSALSRTISSLDYAAEVGPEPQSRGGMILEKLGKSVFRKCIESACLAIKDAEIIINQLNQYNGNGECGTKLADFTSAVLEVLQQLPTTDVSLTFNILERIAEEVMTGDIGAVYSALLMGASYAAGTWADVFRNAVLFLGSHVPIVPGYRTLYDVIKPACDEFVENYSALGEGLWRASLQLSCDAAEKACYETSKMLPKVGVYQAGKSWNMDAGAYSVMTLLTAVNDTLKDVLPPHYKKDDDWRYKLEELLLSLRITRFKNPNPWRLTANVLLTEDIEEEEEAVEAKSKNK